jgi:biopolymer transport protein ExbD
MRVPIHHDDRRQTDIAMTPMIDVVFQLLIFFICTASFQLAEELLPTSLAVAGGSGAPSPNENDADEARILVQAARAGDTTRWAVNGQACETLAHVRSALHAAAQVDRSQPVTLDVAGEVPLGDMIDVYDLCRLERIDRIQFAVER